MYNNFNYISSEVIVAEVKQELRSYFDSGSLNEALIPTYIDNAIRKLKILALEFRDDLLTVEDYKCKLPADFAYMKDAFMLTRIDDISTPVMSSKFEYYKKIYCDNCDPEDCGDEDCETFEQTTQTIPTWITRHLNPCLLRIYYTSREFCTADSQGIHWDSLDAIKIWNKTISSTFQQGEIYIQYWTKPEDEHGPLIPEIVEVENFVKAFLYYKFFEQLYNSVTDESINIIERKLQFYKREYYNHYESALNTLKAETKQQTRDNIRRQNRRFIKFIING